MKRRRTDRSWDLIVTLVGSVLLYGLALASLPGCAHIKHVAVGIGECVLDALPQAVTDVVPEVEQVIKSNDTNIADQLTALGTKYGIGVIICAVQKVIAEFYSAVAHGAMLSSERLIGVIEAQVWLANQNIKPHGAHK